jgi:hypothetical protein
MFDPFDEVPSAASMVRLLLSALTLDQRIAIAQSRINNNSNGRSRVDRFMFVYPRTGSSADRTGGELPRVVGKGPYMISGKVPRADVAIMALGTDPRGQQTQRHAIY